VESSKHKAQSASLNLFLASVLLIDCSTVSGQSNVKTSNARVKPPAAGETQTTAFVTVENPGMYEINITAATADVAGKVELRDGGQTVTFINVPAYGRVDMSPSGAHLTLVALKKPLKDGDTVALTLSTDMDITLSVSAIVRNE